MPEKFFFNDNEKSKASGEYHDPEENLKNFSGAEQKA